MNQVSVRDVVNDPEYLPHTYDKDGNDLTFVQVSRAARAEIRFLFDEHFGGKFAKVIAPAADVRGEIEHAAKAPINFIFHTSFCGSSLLAKALEIPGVASSMREPAVLINLANRLIRSDDAANAERLELALRLLERPFADGEAVVSKQSNFANRLVEPMLRARPASHAILLYSDLETYLISLLKRGMWGRILGRKLFNNLRNWSDLDLGLGGDEIMELTDMQAASLAWMMHIHHFSAMATMFGKRVMLLDSSAMFAAPAETLHRVTDFFALGLSEQDSAAIAAGPIFAKHSKFSDQDYSVEQRRLDTEAVGNANAEELAMVTKWIEAFAAHHEIPLRPGVVPSPTLSSMTSR